MDRLITARIKLEDLAQYLEPYRTLGVSLLISPEIWYAQSDKIHNEEAEQIKTYLGIPATRSSMTIPVVEVCSSSAVVCERILIVD